MKLSVWAKKQGISYKTAWRWWKAGTMPVPVEQLASGTIIVHPAKSVANNSFGNVALYARVSSADQKADLDRQFDRLSEYALAHKMSVVDSVKEIGSGFNGHRRGMMRLLANSNIQTIVIEHRDSLIRFGFEYLEASLSAQNRKIVVIDTKELADDVVRDLHEVIVSMCARLYGKRSAKNRAQKALDAIHHE